MRDEEVEAAAAGDPDAPPLDQAFWREARVVFPRPVRKFRARLATRRASTRCCAYVEAQNRGGT